MSAGNAAFAPRIVPTTSFVNGISKIIKIINGIERKMLTNDAMAPLTRRFSHMFPLDVKNSNKPSKMPSTNVAITEIAVIYNVSIVAAHILSQTTFGNSSFHIRQHLRFHFLLANKSERSLNFFIRTV